jgi:hypothetical protein
MRYKSKTNQLNLDNEAAKELELDEQAKKPTWKLLNGLVVPTTDSATTLIHRRI